MTGLIGRKLGMTQCYSAEGNVVPVTVVQTGPCVVVQKKEPAKDGYSALQVGFFTQDVNKRLGLSVLGSALVRMMSPP